MRLRRCAIVMFEPRERREFNLALLAEGASGLQTVIGWAAWAPHLDDEVMVTAEEVALLGRLSPSAWIEEDALAGEAPRRTLDALSDKGLLVREGSGHDARDRRLRDAHWRSVSAVMHCASRWRGVDAEAMERTFAELGETDVLGRLGAPPPPVRERTPAAERRRLPSAEATPLDALLGRRVTCRNYDPVRALTLAQFASVLHRAYGARAVDEFEPGVVLLKKGVPSAGGLHATEAYLLVQRVDGVAPGLYHYHPVEHALEPIRALEPAEATALARRFVAGQAYFAAAPVLLVAVSRFARNFWKYRDHAKAYRALILDVGHLSQATYLAATELGLAAFVTAAVNEVDIEQAFGLDPLEEGPLAVSGFGIRAATRTEVEFDPLHVAWNDR